MFENLKNLRRAFRSAFKKRSIPVTLSLMLIVLLSFGTGTYAGASFFAPLANVTVTSTIFVTTTSWITSSVMSTVTQTVQGVLTTIVYTSSTSTTTVTSTGPRAGKVVTANGNAHITTAQSVFGGASGVFNGGTAYLSTPDSADWYFTGDFTIDFRVRFNSLPLGGVAMLYSQRIDANNKLELDLYDVGSGVYHWEFIMKNGGNGPDIDVPATVALNTWYHIAAVRQGNSWYLFQAGKQIGTATDSTPVGDYAAGVGVGARLTPTYYLNGWLDEYRVSNGVARWTSNFTPPTSAYTSDSNTVLLLHMDGTDGSTTFTDTTT